MPYVQSLTPVFVSFCQECGQVEKVKACNVTHRDGGSDVLNLCETCRRKLRKMLPRRA